MALDFSNLAASFAIGTVGAGIAGAIIKKRFDAEFDVWRSQRAWKEKSVTELLGPVYMQLERTRRAFERWDQKNAYLEGKVVREGNLAIRDLLLTKPSLIPPELRPHASELVQHYDVWLEEYERWRVSQPASQDSPAYIFVGPQGYEFPKPAEQGFVHAFERYWAELYGPKQQG
jgi:hypothetical protein